MSKKKFIYYYVARSSVSMLDPDEHPIEIPDAHYWRTDLFSGDFIGPFETREEAKKDAAIKFPNAYH